MLRKLKLSRSDYQIGGVVQNEPIRRVSSSSSGGTMAPTTNAAPAVHPVVREVTEDTPPDLLEGTMDLLVVLPSKKTVRMTVNRRTPMMDLLIQVTTANKISPGGHIVQVRNERGIELRYQPSTPIGALDTTTIEIVPKNQVNEYIIVKKQTAKIANQPFEQTFRLQVELPRNQLYVRRASPKEVLEDIFQEVCREKNLDCSKYEIRHPDNLDERLSLDRRIGDYGLQKLTVVSRNSRINSSVSTADIMALQNDEALSKGCLMDSAFKHSRSSVGDSSVSSESAASARGISPSRSDDSRSISPLPPMRPKMKLNTTMSNASSSSGTSSSVPRVIHQQQQQQIQQSQLKSPIEPPPRTKKRAAPPPPVVAAGAAPANDAIRGSQSEGLNRIESKPPAAPIKPTPRKKDAPKDPPGWNNNKSTTLPIHHSRHSSDSSGYHEAIEPHHHDNIHRLDRQQSVPMINIASTLPSNQRVTSSVSVTNLTTISSISTTSLASSNGGGVRKRKAPKPPSVPILHAPKELDEELSSVPAISEENIKETSRISDSAPSLVRAETVEEEIQLKENEEIETPVKEITVHLEVNTKPVVSEEEVSAKAVEIVEETSLPESLAESASSFSETNSTSSSSSSSSGSTTTSSSPFPEESVANVPSSHAVKEEAEAEEKEKTSENIDRPVSPRNSVVMDPSSRPNNPPVVAAVDSVVSTTSVVSSITSDATVPPPRKPRVSRPLLLIESNVQDEQLDPPPPSVKPRPKPRPRPTSTPANVDSSSEITISSADQTSDNSSNATSSHNTRASLPYQASRIGVKVLDNALLDARLARLSRQDLPAVNDEPPAVRMTESHDTATPAGHDDESKNSARPSRKKYRAPDPLLRSPTSPPSSSTSLLSSSATTTANVMGARELHGKSESPSNVKSPLPRNIQGKMEGKEGGLNLQDFGNSVPSDDGGGGRRGETLSRKAVVTKKKRTAQVPDTLVTSGKDSNGRSDPALNGAITSPENEMLPSPSYDFTRTASDRHLSKKKTLYGKNSKLEATAGKKNSSLNRWQNFESLHDVPHQQQLATSPGTTAKRKHSGVKHPLLLAASSSTNNYHGLTSSSSSASDLDYKEESQDGMDETMARKDGNSEGEESFTDSGIPATEENATPSPDAAIMGQLEKHTNSLPSSRRSSIAGEDPEDEEALRELLQAKLENEQEIIDKAFEGIELTEEDRMKSPTGDGAYSNFDLAPSPALTKALESMTPSPLPVTDHTSDDDRAATPSSEDETEEPVEDPKQLFVPPGERKISKSESFSHNSEFDAARKKRLFYKDGSRGGLSSNLKKSYLSSSDEDLAKEERMGANARAESMQNLSRNNAVNVEKIEEERMVKRRVSRPGKSESFRKTASVLNMKDIDPQIAQNPELMATFQTELEAQFEQWKTQFLQKHGRLPSIDKDEGDLVDTESKLTASNSEHVVENGESSPAAARPVESSDAKQVVVLETEAQVHQEIVEAGDRTLDRVDANVEQADIPTTVAVTKEEEAPVQPDLSKEEAVSVKENISVTREELQTQAAVEEPTEVPVKVQATEKLEQVQETVVQEAKEELEGPKAAEPDVPEPVVETQVEEQGNVEPEQKLVEPVPEKEKPSSEEMPVNKKGEEVELRRKPQEEEPQHIYTYSGPPTIKMATWGERPQRSVSVKRDNDYIMGFGQHGSVAAKVNTFADSGSKPPMPRPASMSAAPVVPSKPAVELRTVATLPSVVSSWKQKLEQNEKNRKSIQPTTASVSQVEIKSNEAPKPATSSLERVKKSFQEQPSNNSSPPPLSRDTRRNGPKSVDDTDAASDYSSSSSRPNSSLSRAPSNASITIGSMSDSASSSPIPPSSSLSDRRKVFQGVKPMESSKEKPIPAQNLKGNIASIQKVFEQQHQQQQALRNSRAGSVSSIASSIDSSPSPSVTTGNGPSPVSSAAVMHKVLRGGSMNLDAFRRTPSPSSVSSMSSTSARSPEDSRQPSPLPSSEVVSTNRVVIEPRSQPVIKATEVKSGIKNAENRSIIIVSNEDTVDSNPYRQKLRVVAPPEPKKAEKPVEIVHTNVLRRTPSTPVIMTHAASLPNIDIPVSTGKVSSIAATLKSSNSGFFSSLQRPGKDKPVVQAQQQQQSTPAVTSTTKPFIINEVEKPRKVSSVKIHDTPAITNGIKKETGSVPPPPPPMVDSVQLRPINGNANLAPRPKTLPVSSSVASKNSPSNTPTSPSDARSGILDAIKSSNGNFRLRKTGSSLLLR